MIDRFRIDSSDNAHVVRKLGGVREQLAHPLAARAVLVELKRRTNERQTRLETAHSGQSLLSAYFRRKLGAMPFVQQRLVIE